MVLRYASLAVFLLLVVLAALMGGSFEAGEWYSAISKPQWTPPPWVFAVAWSVLYVLMALAMWQVWVSGHPVRRGALIFWLLQLAVNVAWPWLFFGLHRTGLAMADLGLLIGLVILCMRAFSMASRAAALLMLPYLLWLLFAWLLNFAIWALSGGALGLTFE
jgi:tryptophan-rich sensory protein